MLWCDPFCRMAVLEEVRVRKEIYAYFTEIFKLYVPEVGNPL